MYSSQQVQKRIRRSGAVTTDELLALDGKRLGCFCHPQACHGDVIAAVKWLKSRS